MLPPEEGTTTEENANADITLPDNWGEEVTSWEWTWWDEPKVEEPKAEEPEDKEWEEEEFDLASLFDDTDDLNDSIDKSEEIIDDIAKEWTITPEQAQSLKEENSRLRDNTKILEDKIRKLMWEKSDLMFKTAELEAFWWEFSNPNMLILSRNLEKAQAWDDRSKSKVVSVLKDMLYAVTWEDFDWKMIDKSSDVLAAAESYNASSNPNLKSKEEEQENILTL